MSAGDSARGAMTTPSSLIRLLYIVCRTGSVGSLNMPGVAGGPMMRSRVRSLRSPRALDVASVKQANAHSPTVSARRIVPVDEANRRLS